MSYLNEEVDDGLFDGEFERMRQAAIAQDIAAAKAGKIKPAYSNGRRLAIQAIDVLMGKKANIQKLYNALQERMDVDPVGTYREVIMPLTPKSMIDRSDERGETTDDSNRPRVTIVLPDNGRASAPAEIEDHG